MGRLLIISRGIDALNQKIGVVAIYLVLFAALVSAFNATVRYALLGLITLSRNFQQIPGLDGFIQWYSTSSNALTETQWYMFAAMVLLGAAYTLKLNEHVRVDLFYGSASDRTRLRRRTEPIVVRRESSQAAGHGPRRRSCGACLRRHPG